jgi:hypothetical protein
MWQYNQQHQSRSKELVVGGCCTNRHRLAPHAAHGVVMCAGVAATFATSKAQQCTAVLVLAGHGPEASSTHAMSKEGQQYKSVAKLCWSPALKSVTVREMRTDEEVAGAYGGIIQKNP